MLPTLQTKNFSYVSFENIIGDVDNLRAAGFKVDQINAANMVAFSVEFHGPKHSLYHGYVWKIKFFMPVRYPDMPPLIRFSDKIYHPNISFESGAICVDQLDEQSWSSSYLDLVFVFQNIIPDLLKYPNANDPLNKDAADLLLRDRERYEAKVKEYCETHATKKESSNEDTDEDEIEETGVDDTLSEIDKLMRKLAVEEGEDDNASEDENVSGKANDP